MRFTFLRTAAAILLAIAVAISFPSKSRAQSAAAYIVTDSQSGHIFLASNENRKLQVGSLTKIATAVVVLDWLNLGHGDTSQLATVPQEAAALVGPNPIGLQPGDALSVRDLLYAAMMQSDNIAALTLAHHVGRTLESTAGRSTPITRFVAQMNALARQLGMKNTLFVNPHGFDTNERKLPFSSAADMARLAARAMAKPAFRFYVSQNERQIAIQRTGVEPIAYMLKNTNELLGVDAIDGVKTGTTRRAGECVIISAARAPESRQVAENKYEITPRRLIIVVLGSNARFQIAASLLHDGWAAYDKWAGEGKPSGRGD